MRLTVAALAALIALAAPAAASAKTYDVPAQFTKVLPRVKARTQLPVLLPDRMPYEDTRLYASGSGRKRSWELSLAAAPGCGGATACFVASFWAQKGGQPSGTRRVTLRGGRTGWFRPLSCGASCSPPTIAWREHGAAYWIQANVGTQSTERRILVRMANQAIHAGRR
jgi:hypothetical protein